MERKFKGTPPRLPVIFQSYDPPLYLVTFNTLLRRPLLACEEVHQAFREYVERGLAFHAAVGRYVLMPDPPALPVRLGSVVGTDRLGRLRRRRLGREPSAC